MRNGKRVEINDVARVIDDPQYKYTRTIFATVPVYCQTI